jgi:hypothetical protein
MATPKLTDRLREMFDSFLKFAMKKHLLFLIWFPISIIIIALLFFSYKKTNNKYLKFQEYLNTQQKEFEDIEYSFSEKIGELENERNILEQILYKEQEEHQKNKIVEIIRNTRNPETGETYGDFAQEIIDKGAKKLISYKWNVEEKPEFDTYLVSLVDVIEERGYFWEVNLSTNIVRYISDNWLLKIQYGLTSLRHDNKFYIIEIKDEEIILSQNNNYNTNSDNGIVYKITAIIRNNSGKNITSCNFGANLIVAYSEQKIIEESANRISFSRPSVSEPWLPNRTKEVTIYTKPYDSIYKNYNPIVAFCYITVRAEDPLGYNYSGAFVERDITRLFDEL